jgi:hypothetical protein
VRSESFVSFIETFVSLFKDSRTDLYPLTPWRANNQSPQHVFDVTVRDRGIVDRRPPPNFTAVYNEPPSEPQLILRQRSRCDDDDWRPAITRARELGWVVWPALPVPSVNPVVNGGVVFVAS